MKKIVLLLLITLSSFFVKAQCWSEISAGWNNHTLAIQTDGTLWAWGANNSGSVGDGTTTLRNTPVQIGTATNWAKIDTGRNCSAAIKSDGTLWTWGVNSNGQLGDGTTTDNSSPTQVGTNTNWATCAIGEGHSLAIKNDGTLWAWGLNSSGELGNNTTTNSNTPIQIGSATNWTKIDAGRNFSIAIKTDGTLWGWGIATRNGSSSNLSVPTQIGSGATWSKIATGVYHTIATKTDGTLWSWGSNFTGQLGNNSTTANSTPTQVGSSTNWLNVAGGTEYSVASTSAGTFWAWGRNVYRNLGDGTTTNRLVPIQIGTETDWTKVSAGESHTIALKSNNSRHVWGDNAAGQFGNGNAISSNIPVAVGTCTPPPGASLNFEGSDDYVTLPRFDFSGNNKVTIEVWIKPTNITTKRYYEIARQQNPPSTPDFLVSFQEFGTILSFGLNTATGYTEQDVPITASQWTDGNWHHVAVVYDGITKKVYKDGVLINTENKTGNIISNASSVNFIGFSPESAIEAFHGNMDEIRYWNRALCLGEILNNKDCQLNPTGQTNLFAYYQFNQGDAGLSNAGVTTLTDYSGNSRNGTLTNFTLTSGTTSNWVAPGGISSTVTCSAFVSPVTPTATTPQGFSNTATIADLTTTTGVNIQWYAAASGGAALVTSTALVNGTTYYVSQTVNGCESERLGVVAQTNLSVADNQFNSKLSIYPNPSNGIFNIDINTNASLKVFDIVGKQIMNIKIQTGISQLDLSDYANGIYLMKITNESNQTKTIKIVKQ